MKKKMSESERMRELMVFVLEEGMRELYDGIPGGDYVFGDGKMVTMTDWKKVVGRVNGLKKVVG